MNDIQATLLTLLNSYGDIVELDWDFDVDNIFWDLLDAKIPDFQIPKIHDGFLDSRWVPGLSLIHI